MIHSDTLKFGVSITLMIQNLSSSFNLMFFSDKKALLITSSDF
jgi:hypothetical protein